MSEHYHQQWSNKKAQWPLAEVNRLKDENAVLRAQLAALRKLEPEHETDEQIESYAAQRNNFLQSVKPLGYNSARAYIEAMATKYSVDVEEARIAFLACGYEGWNTEFVKALQEMKDN